MCLSLAGRVSRVEGDEAVVDVEGRQRRVSLALLVLEGTPVTAGDWVLLHTGLAVSVLDVTEAAELMRLRQQMGTSEQEDSP